MRLSLRLKGAAALLHWKGESTFAAENEAWFDASSGGLSLQPKQACGSAAPGGRAPSAIEYTE